MIDVDYIKDEIRNGRLESAIQKTLDFMEKEFFHSSTYLKVFYDEMILLSGREKTIKEKILLGIISLDNESVERNTISYELIKLLNRIPNDLSKVKSIDTNDVTQKIRINKENNSFEYDVFLSFSTKDLELSTNLWEVLTGYGYRVFFSSDFFKRNIGRSFNDEISKALISSKSFVLIWTSNASSSKWVKIEYKTFFNEFYEEGKRDIYVLHPHEEENIKLPVLLRFLQRTADPFDLVKSMVNNVTQLEKNGSYPTKIKGDSINHVSEIKLNQNSTQQSFDSASKPQKISLMIF